MQDDGPRLKGSDLVYYTALAVVVLPGSATTDGEKIDR